jgi:hydroxyethylthiazole kinase-like uncharacterized protein yjeF
MKILNRIQILEADRQTLRKASISSTALMERSAMACMHWITAHYTTNQVFAIFCGTGNNGGDGMALCRLLTEKKYNCSLYEYPLSETPAKDYQLNKAKIKGTSIKKLTAKAVASLPGNVVVIDALLGTGTNRPVEGVLKEILCGLNQLPNPVISIDTPSGLMSEYNSKNPAEGIVQAQHTLSFLRPKLAFLLPERGGKAGIFHLLDIGLDPKFLEEVKTPLRYLTVEKTKNIYRSPNKFDHKGNNGHLLVVGGSKGKMGAVVLAAKAGMRTGAGKLSVLCPQSGIEILQKSIPEVMIENNSGIDSISGYYGLNHNTIAVGPGMGTDPQTTAFMTSLLSQPKAQLVIDADALNMMAKEKQLLKKLPKNTVLTPHPKEFERWVGSWQNDQQKIQLLTDLTERYQVICVLKGAHTAVALPNGSVWFNSSGNPGMATAGSGDVLTGIIGGLMAKGYTPEDAALLGVYAHGRAADIISRSMNYNFMMASDIIRGLNEVWMELENQQDILSL